MNRFNRHYSEIAEWYWLTEYLDYSNKTFPTGKELAQATMKLSKIKKQFRDEQQNIGSVSHDS